MFHANTQHVLRTYMYSKLITIRKRVQNNKVYTLGHSVVVVPCGGYAQQELTPVKRKGWPVVAQVLLQGNADGGSDTGGIGKYST